MTHAIRGRLAMALLLLACTACSKDPGNGIERAPAREFVVVYSSIDESRTAPAYQAFTAATGIRIQQVTADDDRLLQMMLDKAHAPAADLYLAAGAATLWNASDAGVLRPTHADELYAAIPPQLRDPENQWFGLADNAHVLVFDPRVLTADRIPGYEMLADTAWRGLVCLSSSTSPGNTALIALLIERHGLRQAEVLVRQFMSNLAVPVFRDPQALLAAVESGRCSIGISSLEAALQRTATGTAQELGIAAPAHGGVLVDVVGGGVTRHAGNAAGAQRLLQWLAGPAGQAILADSLPALPAAQDVTAPPRYAAWQDLRHGEINVARFGMRHREAIDLAERARYP